MNLTARRGKFELSPELIESDPDTYRKIMGKCIITRCEYIFFTQSYCYNALCDQFDEIETNLPAPSYEVVIDKEILFKRT